MKMVIWPHTEL